MLAEEEMLACAARATAAIAGHILFWVIAANMADFLAGASQEDLARAWDSRDEVCVSRTKIDRVFPLRLEARNSIEPQRKNSSKNCVVVSVLIHRSAMSGWWI